MAIWPDYYDYDKRECKDCGMLLQPEIELVKLHAKEDGHILKKLEKQFGRAPIKEGKMEEKELIVRDVMPTFVAPLTEIEARYQQLQEFVKKQMVENEDYGTIPGCPKPSLFKPGAEKLLEIYGYAVSDIEIVNKVEDWDKAFFNYEVKATAISKRSGQIMGVGIGSCNSKEKKFVKQDAYSLTNTLLKMAKKRAIVDLALLVTRSSAIFTQDVEDMDIGTGDKTEKQTPPATEKSIPGELLLCSACNADITEKVYKFSTAKHGKALCFNCQKEQ